MSRVLPILFNTEMVQEILRLINPKTATRRVIKGYIPKDAIWGYTLFTPKGYISCRGKFPVGYGEKFFKLPCQQGDILYVRETWSTRRSNSCMGNTTTGCPYDNGETAPGPCFEDEYIYKATDGLDSSIRKWIPSIHMPKEAARIWLKVTDVRVERLQDIMKDPPGPSNQVLKEGCKYGCDFIAVWENTIKKEEKYLYGWDANPWVWVIEFERCERPKDV